MSCSIFLHPLQSRFADDGRLMVEVPPHGAASFFAEDCLENPRESVEVRLIVLTEA